MVVEEDKDDGFDPAALARAEAALAALADSYLIQADEAIVRISATLEAALADPRGRAAHLILLYRLVHDVKGQAGTFGYPLVTEIGRRLCRVLAGATDPDPAQLERIADHVAALRRAVAERLAGDGGEEGRQLLDALEP